MNAEQWKQFEQLKEVQEQLRTKGMDYWATYSNIDTWQFWVNVLMFIIPLVILYFFIDRKRAFLLGFFGYSHHIIAIYFDGFATRYVFWEYPYKFIPFLPNNIGLDTSLIPVVYILLYQWLLKNGKNYYLYAIIVSAIFSFVLKPILVTFDLVQLSKGTTFFHLFLVYLLGAVLAKWLTNVFIYFEKDAKGSGTK